jgi:FtsH-binding integral membrane protein
MDRKSNAEMRRERMYQMVSQDELVSDNVYNLVIGLTISSGFVLNVLVSLFMGQALSELPYWFSLVLYFGCSFGGMAIAYKSNNAIVSYLGFMLLAFGFSTILFGFVSYYAPQTVLKAVYVTLAASMLMMAISTVFPRFFLSIGKTLFISLLVVLVVELVMLFMGVIEPTAMDFLVSIIFCGYIGFDWARAQNYPKTIDNAIDASVDIYVDIVNLFIRVLSILGKRD